MCAALLCGPAPAAFGWGADAVGGRSVRVWRSADETPGVVTVYYMNGVVQAAQFANGSWDSTGAGGAFAGAGSQAILFDGVSLSAEYQPSTSNSAYLVVCPDGTRQMTSTGRTQDVNVAAVAGSSVANGSLPVSPYSSLGTPTWRIVDKSGSTTIPVSGVGSSVSSGVVSLSGTLPVDPWSATGISPGGVGVVIAGAVALVGVGLGRHLSHV